MLLVRRPNTSAGAPCCICVTSACEPAKLYEIDRSGRLAERAVFSAVKASVSEAAAKTESGPCGAGASAATPRDPVPLAHAAVVSASATTTAGPTAHRDLQDIVDPRSAVEPDPARPGVCAR